MTLETAKPIIDNMSLYELLSKWRHAVVGDEMFQGEVGDYYAKVMYAKRDADSAAWVSASKSIGW
jgi:hypothetical protein